MQTQLTTTSSGGTQSTTQSPQSSTQSNLSSSTYSSGIQPGTTLSLLSTNSGGVSLTPTQVDTVSLSASTSASSQSKPSITKHHHINGVLIVIIIGLFLLAIFLFWNTSRQANTTTE